MLNILSMYNREYKILFKRLPFSRKGQSRPGYNVIFDVWRESIHQDILHEKPEFIYDGIKELNKLILFIICKGEKTYGIKVDQSR